MQKYLTVSSLSHHRIAVSLLLKPVVIAVSQSIRNFWCQTLGEISCVISECFRVDSFPTKGKWVRAIRVKLVSCFGETTAANCHPADRAFRPEILPDVGGDTRHKRRHFFWQGSEVFLQRNTTTKWDFLRVWLQVRKRLDRSGAGLVWKHR